MPSAKSLKLSSLKGGIAWQKTSYARSVSQRPRQSMSACSMVSGFVAKLMANSRSRIAHWQCTKTQKLRDGRALLGAQRTGRRLLRRLGHELPPTILDEGRLPTTTRRRRALSQSDGRAGPAFTRRAVGSECNLIVL